MKEQVQGLEHVYQDGVETLAHLSDVKMIVIIGLILLVLILMVACVGLAFIIRNSQVIRDGKTHQLQCAASLEANNKKMLENQAYFKAGLEGAQKEIADIKETIRVNVKPGIYELISYLKMYEERNKVREKMEHTQAFRNVGNSKNEIIINGEMPPKQKHFSEIGFDAMMQKMREDYHRIERLKNEVDRLKHDT